MLRPFSKFLICLVAVFALLGGLGVLTAEPIFAQVEEGLETVGEQTGLSGGDPKVIVANIINAFLGTLGILAILIVLYGGFTWMTSGGSEEKVQKAKQILTRGVIGLTIILLSYVIASFIIGAIIGATNGGNGSGGSSGGGNGFSGGGSSSSFRVTDFSPEGAVAIRNVQYRVTVSRVVDGTTLEGNAVITNTSTGEEVPGTWSTSNNRMTFTPTAACPTPNEDRFCFDADTTFSVSLDSDIKSTSGTSLVCTGTSCASEFTTGNLVDTEDPEVDFTVPDNGDGVPTDSVQAVQAHATDDSEISAADFAADSVVFDAVGATGDDLSDVTVETLWDTVDLENGERYRLTVIATDIAGNTSEDSITVVARPATCFNGVLDTDLGETGLDCGGDSSSAEYCGACDGSSCTEDAECASGSCVDGVCLALPEIESISPASGAPGTYVTISGAGFGSTEGTIEFTSADGTTLATIPSCAAGWSDTEIVVEVPTDAIDGAITITTSNDYTESTNDDNGAIIEDFDVTDEVRPKLCALTPDGGEPTDAVVLTGFDFGGEQDESTVAFGSVAAGSYTSWGDTQIAVTAPSASDAYYQVSVTVNGLASNELTFALEDESAAPPSIAEVSPSSGAIGQYVTLTGTNFGSRTGTVWFVSDETGESALAETDFPEVCGDDYWDDGEITVIVPSLFTSENDVAPGAYAIYVRTAEGSDSSAEDFTIVSGDPAPGICLIDPDEGDAGDTVTVYGEYFGSTEGTITFHDGVEGTIVSWDREEISVTVPSGIATGPVMATSSDAQESNTLNFALGDGGDDVVAIAEPATYGWYFSTGEILAAPEVYTECSDTRVSAVPNARFTDEVCTNAVVYAEFSTDMDEVSLGDAVSVAECTGNGEDPCRSTEDVAGEISTTATSFTFTPTEDWNVSTSYRVTISTDATTVPSASGDVTALRSEKTWDFTTKSTTEACVIEEVRVTPSASTIATQYGEEEFNALPLTGCVITDSSSYGWSWSVNESYAGLTTSSDGTCDGGTASCATVVGNAEGVALVTATEPLSAVTDDAELTINFTDPYVEQYQPNCSDACTEAMVSATFNTPMSQTSVESASSVRFYECDNELCLNLTEVDTYSIACEDDGEGDDCEEVQIVHDGLTSGGFYRVVISGDVSSTSGVALTRTNYSGDFSWTFRVRDDGVACAIERITISPDSAVALTTEDRRSFSVSAYSQRDSCSVQGQELATTNYSWSWTDPIEDDGAQASIEVAQWWESGAVDTDTEGVANGCTASCIAGGSQAWVAICGDGVVGTGEDCDDGGTVSGDGCSSSCLREGGDVVGICGDGILDRLADGSGEDCDDGGTVSGDGCSSSCLNEGSRSVGAVCGNGDLAYDPTVGGEDCEDGNVRNGDGCSSRCINEGSVTLAYADGAVCGNGTIDTPHENCDTALSTEGCSSTCLLEGSSAIYATPSVCGDNVIGTGEECDEGDALSGDGCSADCLLEGSSLSFDSPSVCGDGVVGDGELLLCESDGGDGFVDGLQLALISEDASLEVDTETRSAVATIQVTEPTSLLRTTATYTLMCTASVDTDCPDPSVYGVSANSCCMARPEVSLQPIGENVCRNASIYGVFSREMNLRSFTTRNSDGTEQPKMYAVLDVAASGLTSCPSTHTTLARMPSSWAARAWFTLRSFVAGSPAYAATGDCVVEVTGYSQSVESADEGTYRVSMQYETALEASGIYTLTLEVDGDTTDTTRSGVLSKNGVALLSTTSGETVESQQFTTGSDICTLDEVLVEDVDDSAYYFSQVEEEHRFIASAVSYTTGAPQEITSLPGVYAWEWQSWTDDSSGEVVAAASDEDQADVQAVGENGRATVVATAKITADSVGSSVDEEVSGSVGVTAYLCENPWPHISVFPWQDNATGGLNGNAYEGDGGWMNFSSYYCRDEIDVGTGDYGATVVLAETRDLGTTDDILLKEYLLEVGDDGDAVGIRIVKNPYYLSPMQWFAAQGFSGSPKEVEVDGFAAVQDGRTTYIAAPNQTGSSLYSNIYIISYNEDADSLTVDIHDQLLANFSFATNVEAVALCYDGGSATETVCDEDSDCDEGHVCADSKAKLRRDTLRLADMTDISATLEDYSDENGAIPALGSGTYVRGLSASPWTSWSDALGGALDVSELAADPLNTYQGCGTDPYSEYDSVTCVNETKGHYICPADSYAYHYRAIGTASYELYADLEYDSAAWVNSIDSDASDNVAITIGGADAATTASGFSSTAFCDGATIYGSETTCGDGVVGGSELCEIGQAGGAAASCDTDEDGIDDGFINQVCNSTCDVWIDDSTAECVAATCGNGVIDGLETCDDGTYNGRYGFCGSSCNYDSAFYCGDGMVSASEACDCGTLSVWSSVETTARPYGGTPGACAGVNGTYDADSARTCAWDCAAPAAYCGDVVISSGETCDTEPESWAGALCGDRITPCTSDDDCSAGDTCGDVHYACPVGDVCVGGDNDGELCNGDNWSEVGLSLSSFEELLIDGALAARCVSGGGTCDTSGITYQTYRTRSCADAADANACTWNTWQYCGIDGQSCGNGEVEGGEECDDGNTDGTDACTNSCTNNVCGDGVLYVGEEQCDEGVDNGAGCDARYGSTCMACSATCRYVASSGDFCGDGTINGTEYCDAYDVPYNWYDSDYEDEAYADGDGLLATCSSAYDTLSYSEVYGEEYEYATATGPAFSDPVCRRVGICSGGPDNGEHCTRFLSGPGDTCSGDGTCTFPACGESCMSTCPFTYDDATIMLTSNQVGARASASVNLYSYDASDASYLPNAATITMPSCEAAASITANISYVGEPVQTYVVFVTDLSLSMSYAVTHSGAPSGDESSRYEIAIESLEEAVDTLFDELGDNVQIGLVAYKTELAGRCYEGGTECSDSTDCGSGDTCNEATVRYRDFAPVDESDQSQVITELETYFPDTSWSGTPILEGMTAAKAMLDGVYSADAAANSRYIAILLSDGNLPEGADDPTAIIESLKNRYELYTATISSDTTTDGAADIAKMAEWSSGNPDEATGIDYAYDAQTEDELTQMYRDIIDSIIGVTVQILSDGYTDSATVSVGNGVTLPWPEGFICDPLREQDLPIRLSFNGTGQMAVSNVRVNYCAP